MTLGQIILIALGVLALVIVATLIAKHRAPAAHGKPIDRMTENAADLRDGFSRVRYMNRNDPDEEDRQKR